MPCKHNTKFSEWEADTFALWHDFLAYYRIAEKFGSENVLQIYSFEAFDGKR